MHDRHDWPGPNADELKEIGAMAQDNGSGTVRGRPVRRLRSVVTTSNEAAILRDEILHLDDTRELLVRRVERSLVALALTVEAQAAVNLRHEVMAGALIDGSPSLGTSRLELTAEQCRAIIAEFLRVFDPPAPSADHPSIHL